MYNTKIMCLHPGYYMNYLTSLAMINRECFMHYNTQ